MFKQHSVWDVQTCSILQKTLITLTHTHTHTHTHRYVITESCYLIVVCVQVPTVRCVSVCLPVAGESTWAEQELTLSWLELTLGPDSYQLFISFCSACANLNVSHHGNSLPCRPEGVGFSGWLHPRFAAGLSVPHSVTEQCLVSSLVLFVFRNVYVGVWLHQLMKWMTTLLST